MAETRSYPRATPPHPPTLAASLAAVLSSFYAYYEAGVVQIAAESFAGTTDAAIQAIVTAAPSASPQLDAKAQADALTLVEKAAYLTLLDLINVEPGRHSAAAITSAQFVTAVKNKVDTAP